MSVPSVAPGMQPSTCLGSRNAVLDMATVLCRVGWDRTLLKELVQALVEDLPAMLECLERSVTEGDALKTEQLAHALKSSVGTFAAGPATEAARRLELIGRQANMTAAPEAYAWLGYELSRLLPALVEMVEEKS